MASDDLKGELHKVLPVINTSGSDSAMLDNTLEFHGDERHGSSAGSHDCDSGAVGK